jgi:hypothetical protein
MCSCIAEIQMERNSTEFQAGKSTLLQHAWPLALPKHHGKHVTHPKIPSRVTSLVSPRTTRRGRKFSAGVQVLGGWAGLFSDEGTHTYSHLPGVRLKFWLQQGSSMLKPTNTCRHTSVSIEMRLEENWNSENVCLVVGCRVILITFWNFSLYFPPCL